MTLLASGTGPAGRAPPYAVMASKPGRGINALEGRPMALPKAGAAEAKVLSNFALEGEARVKAFFGRVHWSNDLPEIARRTQTGLAAGTMAYEALAERLKLHVVATLRGMPLPALAEVGMALSDEQRAKLSGALTGGLALPPAGLMTGLVAPKPTEIADITRALQLAPGQRPVRRAIWSPTAVERIRAEDAKVGPRGRYPLNTPAGRWREPAFPDIE